MKEFDELLKTIRTLRGPGGCPWDRVQKIYNMKSYLLEEMYELFDGIDQKEIDIVREEIGDIILILIVMSEMFKEKGLFDIKDSLSLINQKLIARHPHVFSSKESKTKDKILQIWIKNKAKSKKRKNVSDRLPKTAPALALRYLLLKEQSHLERNSKKKLSSKNINKDILLKGKELETESDKKAILCDLLALICEYGFSMNLDLEPDFRKSTINAAKKVKY